MENLIWRDDFYGIVRDPLGLRLYPVLIQRYAGEHVNGKPIEEYVRFYRGNGKNADMVCFHDNLSGIRAAKAFVYLVQL